MSKKPGPPQLAMCDPNDILGVSFLSHHNTGAEQVFLRDNHPGGVCIAELGYDIVNRLGDIMRDIMTSCDSGDGYPR